MSKPKGKGEAARASRRDFAKTLAALAATPLVSSTASASTQEPTPAKPRPPQTPPADAPSPSAEAMAEVVRQRYSSFLSKEQLEQVKRSIDRGLRNGDRLKQFKLKNADEPAFAFTAEVR